MDAKTVKRVKQALKAAATTLSAISTPDASLRKLAKSDVETELLYHLDENEGKTAGEILDELEKITPNPDHPSRVAGMNVSKVEKALHDMSTRGLLSQDKTGRWLRNKSAINFDEVREGIFQARQLAKQFAEHLEHLSEMVPQDYDHHGHDVRESLDQATQALHNVLDDMRSLSHSFE